MNWIENDGLLTDFSFRSLGKRGCWNFLRSPSLPSFLSYPPGEGAGLYTSFQLKMYTLRLRCWIDAASAEKAGIAVRAHAFFFSCLVPEFLSRGRPWIMCQGDEHTNSHFQFSNPPLHQLLLAAKLLFCSHDRVSCVVCVIKIAKWHACKWKNRSQSGLKSVKKSHFLY